MARLRTYADDPTVTDTDKVIGTDGLDNSTKNFTVGDLRDHILGTDSTFNGIVPEDRYSVVGPDNFPRQGQLVEIVEAEDDVAIPANFVWNLSRDGIGFVVELRRFGQLATIFAYDIHSLIGETWVSTEYPTAGEQTITAFLDPRFTTDSTGINETWRFRTTLANPLSIDSTAGTVGRALTTVVASALSKRTVVTAAEVRFLGLPTAPTGNTGNLYTQTGAQIAGITGQDNTKFLIVE